MLLPSGVKLRGTANGLIALAARTGAPNVVVVVVVVPTMGDVVVTVVVVVVVGVKVGLPKGPVTVVLPVCRPPPSEPPA